MDARTAIEPVTVLKTKSAQLIRQARDTRQPIFITQNGKASAVLQDIESYEEQRKTLHLLRLLAQGDLELSRGEGISHARLKKEMEKKLKELRNA
jgi:prevent-host-death family protein